MQDEPNQPESGDYLNAARDQLDDVLGRIEFLEDEEAGGPCVPNRCVRPVFTRPKSCTEPPRRLVFSDVVCKLQCSPGFEPPSRCRKSGSSNGRRLALTVRAGRPT